jgi:hypothetical protein
MIILVIVYLGRIRVGRITLGYLRGRIIGLGVGRRRKKKKKKILLRRRKFFLLFPFYNY